MKKYIVYKTTCLVNDRFYIGQHETYNLNDNYLGSGALLKQAISKYGHQKFKREILFLCKTKEEVNLKEAEIVNEEILKDPLCYNLALGGQGGNLGEEARVKSKSYWTKEKRNLQSVKMKELMKRSDMIAQLKIIRRRKRSPEEIEKVAKQLRGKKQSIETITKRANSNRGQKRSDLTKAKISEGNTGKIRSSEAKRRMSDSAKNRKVNFWAGKKRPTKECPHCGKVGADYLMSRWHFDNCPKQTCRFT